MQCLCSGFAHNNSPNYVNHLPIFLVFLEPQAIHVLNEVVRLAPTLGDSYHMLGLIYNAIGDKIKAMNFYILAACLTPKDPYIWKLLIARSM